MKKCIKYLFCFNSLSANKIEIIKISLSGFGAILTIIGLGVIHWKYTSRVMKIFQILSLIFFLMLIGISSFFLYIRKKSQINKYITLCILLCFLEIFLSILSFFFNLITAIGALPDLRKKNKSDESDEDDININNLNNSEKGGSFLVSNGEFSYAIVSLIFIIFIWIVLLLLSISDLIRIKLGIDGSYDDYINEKKMEENIKKDPNLITTTETLGCSIDKKQKEKLYEIFPAKRDNNMNTPEGNKINKNENNDNMNHSYNKEDTEQKNILKYSYKESLMNRSHLRNKNCNSVDDIHKSRNGSQNKDKEKYFEKYLEGYGANPNYSNFENRSILNISTMNNSINVAN